MLTLYNIFCLSAYNMVFNSIAYILFLTLTAIAYYVFPAKTGWIWLLLASTGYYLSFVPAFLALLIPVVVVNYLMGLRLSVASAERKNRVLFLVICINLLILLFFKYFTLMFPGYRLPLYSPGFFFRTDPVNTLILPLGLSYLVFTVLSYQIEIKRETVRPERHFGYFSLYLLFFPKIAQGPIERPQHFIPQLHQERIFNYDMVADGLKLMLWGYFKKMVVADRLALYVNAVYGNSNHHNGTTLLIATLFFSFQIYADFSGYTDIALGSAKIFGFNLTGNFKRPYFSATIKEFWNRWHITFSTWIRDYIFLPLAFFLSKRMKKQHYLHISAEKWIYLVAVMVTFSVCGLWHGVGWTFLLWGMLFGVYLAHSNWTAKLKKKARKQLHIRKTNRLFIAVNILTTFSLVTFAWIFFKADSVAGAFDIIHRIFTTAGFPFYESPKDLVYALFGTSVLMAVDVKQEFFNGKFSLFYNRFGVIRIGTIVVLAMAILLFGVFDAGQFIYFQF